MVNGDLKGVIEWLSQIECDCSIPKSVRIRIKTAMESLNDEEKILGIRIDKSLEELENIADDPNLPDYTRMQIWRAVSLLESRE